MPLVWLQRNTPHLSRWLQPAGMNKRSTELSYSDGFALRLPGDRLLIAVRKREHA